MKHLLAAGCSFIFGNDLADQQGTSPSISTFPALLANDLGLTYRCVAVPGSGSDSHVRQVIENVDQDTELVVVSWSYAGRFEFDFDNLGWHSVRHLGSGQFWATEMLEQFQRQFYGNLTQRYQWYHYVKDIVFLQQWLTAKGIPYLFCNMDPDFSKKSIKNSTFRTLYTEIDQDKWFFWKSGKKNQGFRNWARNMGFEIALEHLHPLEHAHRASFNLIKEHLTHKELYDIRRYSDSKTQRLISRRKQPGH